jgi:hypothetical protein
VITEIMSDSIHPGSNTFGAGLANGDWWELVNLGSEPVDLTGYLWDDEDRLAGDQFAIFPSFVLPPQQIVLIVEEDDVDLPDGFRDAWGLPASQLILARSQFGGRDEFSGISTTGDEVNLYNVQGALVARRITEAADEGFSFHWGTDDVYRGLSQEGIDGARKARSDGSGEILSDPNYVPLFLDVASPGHVEGLTSNEVRGDFDGDDLVGVSDIDLLCNAMAGNTSSLFDLTGDEVMNQDDLVAFLEIAGTIAGDTDLNRQVNFTDFLKLSANFGAAEGVSWSGGDFDCNGAVGFPDFLTLSAHFGAATSVAATAAVPEPNGLVLIVMTGLMLLRMIRS